jgi:hypothetical protein
MALLPHKEAYKFLQIFSFIICLILLSLPAHLAIVAYKGELNSDFLVKDIESLGVITSMILWFSFLFLSFSSGLFFTNLLMKHGLSLPFNYQQLSRYFFIPLILFTLIVRFNPFASIDRLVLFIISVLITLGSAFLMKQFFHLREGGNLAASKPFILCIIAFFSGIGGIFLAF